MPKTVKSGAIDIAQTFNQLFSTIADTYVSCDNHEQQHNFQTLDKHVRSKLARNTKFVIPDVTHEYVLHKPSTQPNRATGADGISANANLKCRFKLSISTRVTFERLFSSMSAQMTFQTPIFRKA